MNYHIVEFYTGGYGITASEDAELPNVLKFSEALLYNFKTNEWDFPHDEDFEYGCLIGKEFKCESFEYIEKCLIELQGLIKVYKTPF